MGTLLVESYMKFAVLAWGLLLLGCAKSHTIPEAISHWALSSDYGEYHGLYLYSQTADGTLWRTHFPENHMGKPEPSENVGTWKEAEDTLSWCSSSGGSSTIFKSNGDGNYIKQGGGYHSPVELIPILVRNGKLCIK